MLLRSLAMMLAVSPVACMKIDWQYTDHRSSGDSAKEGAGDLEEGEGALVVDLPASLELGDAKVAFKVWPVGDCEGTKEDAELGADEFPYTLVVDAACDYKMTFATGGDEPGEPVEILGEDLADAGDGGVVVDVKLAKEEEKEEQEANPASGTGTESGTGAGTGAGTGTEAQVPTGPASGQGSELGIKEFRIPAGTGNGAWNTAQTPIVARIGDTVRIFNDDTVTHRLHTNGRPCPHGADIRPGESRDCVIQSQFVGDLYDHNTNGKVFIQATR